MPDDLKFSDSLADLAHRMKAEHEAYVAAVRHSLTRAMAAGDMLIEAKAQLQHGQWRSWLDERCGIPERTASRYMRLARNRAAIADADIGHVADLTVRGAESLLAPEAEAEAEEPAYEPVLGPGEAWLDITAVIWRKDLYPRDQIYPDVIERYTQFVDDVPVIEVNQRHELIDGFMRLKAAERIGRKTIRAIVTEIADDMEHLLLECERNSSPKHGLQLPLDVELKVRDRRRRNAALDAAAEA